MKLYRLMKKKWFFLKKRFIYFYVCWCFARMYVCMWVPDSLVLEWQTVVSCRVGAENGNWVLWKNSGCHLSKLFLNLFRLFLIHFLEDQNTNANLLSLGLRGSFKEQFTFLTLPLLRSAVSLGSPTKMLFLWLEKHNPSAPESTLSLLPSKTAGSHLSGWLCFYCPEDWTWDLMHARQVLHRWAAPQTNVILNTPLDNVTFNKNSMYSNDPLPHWEVFLTREHSSPLRTHSCLISTWKLTRGPY